MKSHYMALAAMMMVACGSNINNKDTSSSSSDSCPYNVVRQNSGGWLLTRPEVHLNFWGDWKSSYNTPSNLATTWFTLLNNGTVLQRLSEYGIHEGICDTDYYMTTGSSTYANDGGVFNDAGITKVLDDDTFVTVINAQIRLNQLPYPNDNTLYIIFIEPGDITELMVQNHWSGYHNNGSYGTQKYAYAIVKYNGDDGTIITTSHEIYEAVTDPGVGSGYWDRPSGEEMGDLCQGNNEIVDGFQVQTVWSQQLCQCQ